MDPLADLLSTARANNIVFGQTILESPWSVRFEDGAPLTLATMVRGSAWVTPDDGRPVSLGTGDIAVIRGPAAYAIGDVPGSPPRMIAYAGGVCTDPAGLPLGSELTLGARTCGDGFDGPNLLLTGTYQLGGAIGQRLVEALPPLLTVPAEYADAAAIALVAAEIDRELPGQQVVLDRLADVLLVSTLRTWFTMAEANEPGWSRAMTDPVVGPALRLLHDDPAYPWTVASLAAKVGVSRATFAERFRRLLGEPPMRYLAGWRACLAADRLRAGDETVDAIARDVGYSNAFSLSAAFKRAYGVHPTAYRRG